MRQLVLRGLRASSYECEPVHRGERLTENAFDISPTVPTLISRASHLKCRAFCY